MNQKAFPEIILKAYDFLCTLILVILLQSVSFSCNLKTGFTSADILGALNPEF